MLPSKVQIRKLGLYSLPLSGSLVDGGRLSTPAGEIAQILNGVFFCYLAYIEFLDIPSVFRGDHYHLQKEEFLYIIKGRLQAVYVDVDTAEKGEIVLETGDLINIKPKCAHLYSPLEYTQAIEFSHSLFDPMDTKKYPVSAVFMDGND